MDSTRRRSWERQPDVRCRCSVDMCVLWHMGCKEVGKVLKIEDIKPGSPTRCISYEIEPMVTISQREYERLVRRSENIDAVIQAVMDSQKDLRQTLKEMGF